MFYCEIKRRVDAIYNMYPWRVGEGSSSTLYYWNEATQKLENKQKVIAYDLLNPSIDTKLTKDSISVYSKEALLTAAIPRPDWNNAVSISFPYTATTPGIVTAYAYGGNFRNLSCTVTNKALLGYAYNGFYTGQIQIPVDTGDIVNFSYANAAYFVPWKTL